MYDLRHKKPRVMATTDHQLQYNKNIVTTSDSNELSTRITECLGSLLMSHDPDPEVLLRITVCQRNKDHWLGSCVRIMYKNPALTIAPKI
ncbi:hypothetical protein Hanom_Chr06g00553661 [Helianthus anomalus]